jgi:hypothetical protein
MKVKQQFAAVRACALIGLLLTSAEALAQATPGSASIKPPADLQQWEYAFTVDGYIVQNGTSFANPVFTADHKWLHLEGRYNDENLRTGSLWVGYNFVRGDVDGGGNWQFAITPMVGGVFGRTNGIAPGCEASLSYRKKLEASINNEYVFDTTSKSGNFYYSWPQLTYSPVDWFHVGAVAQHTAAYQSSISLQRGFLVGFSRKQWEFTTYVFDPGSKATVVVLEWGVSF